MLLKGENSILFFFVYVQEFKKQRLFGPFWVTRNLMFPRAFGKVDIFIFLRKELRVSVRHAI